MNCNMFYNMLILLKKEFLVIYIRYASYYHICYLFRDLNVAVKRIK